jgi:hypothetical protein
MVRPSRGSVTLWGVRPPKNFSRYFFLSIIIIILIYILDILVILVQFHYEHMRINKLRNMNNYFIPYSFILSDSYLFFTNRITISHIKRALN